MAFLKAATAMALSPRVPPERRCPEVFDSGSESSEGRRPQVPRCVARSLLASAARQVVHTTGLPKPNRAADFSYP